MNEQQPTPTEKSQIVINFISNPNPLIMRYGSVKKGAAARDKLVKAWNKYRTGHTTDGSIHRVEADMFDADVDLTTIGSIAFVDHVVRNKFVPA
jgi:hypothetical protein